MIETREELISRIYDEALTVDDETKPEEKPETILEVPDVGLFFEGKKFISKRLGDFIQTYHKFKTLIGSGIIYFYKDGLYCPNGTEIIKMECKRILGESFTKDRVTETIAYIKAGSYINPNEIDNNWINLENGLLHPISQEFIPHNPEIFTTTRSPIFYDPEADCPTFKEKLLEKTDEQTMNVIQEMFGYCFSSGQKFEVAFLLYGRHRTMKSTTLFVLENLLGKHNIQSFSLQDLTDKSFAIAYLYGSPANICGDLHPNELKNTGNFMKLTGGDPLTAAKKHCHPMTWYPSTKLIFSCNQIPTTTNKNLAFYRRWILLHFNKQTPKDEIDFTLKEQLLDELSGILNWALEGLQRIEDRKEMSYWLDEYGVKDIYERNSDTISSFIFNNIDMEDDMNKIKKREVYKKYLLYCADLNSAPENQVAFGKKFLSVTGCGTGRINDIPAYRGVNLKGEYSKQKTLDDK